MNSFIILFVIEVICILTRTWLVLKVQSVGSSEWVSEWVALCGDFYFFLFINNCILNQLIDTHIHLQAFTQIQHGCNDYNASWCMCVCMKWLPGCDVCISMLHRTSSQQSPLNSLTFLFITDFVNVASSGFCCDFFRICMPECSSRIEFLRHC